MAVEKAESEPQRPEESVELLRRAERVTAMIFGLLTLGAGGAAVFLSENQAGTAVLLVASAAFLLVGIQGTPLVRFDSDTASVELERRRRIDQVIKTISDEPNPDVARGAIEAASIIEPKLAQALSGQEAQSYELRVHEAFARIGATIEPRAGLRDFVVELASGSPVLAIIKYRRTGPLPMTAVREAMQRLRGQFHIGVLVVTNAPLSGEVRAINQASADQAEAVTWNDERDDDLLLRAVGQMSR